jgi:hypothetical protein
LAGLIRRSRLGGPGKWLNGTLDGVQVSVWPLPRSSGASSRIPSNFQGPASNVRPTSHASTSSSLKPQSSFHPHRIPIASPSLSASWVCSHSLFVVLYADLVSLPSPHPASSPHVSVALLTCERIQFSQRHWHPSRPSTKLYLQRRHTRATAKASSSLTSTACPKSMQSRWILGWC